MSRTWLVSDRVVLPAPHHAQLGDPAPDGADQNQPDRHGSAGAARGVTPLRVGSAAIGVRGSIISDVVVMDPAELSDLLRDGAAHPSLAADPSDTWVDVRGKLISPGFINAHTHLAMSAFRGVTAAAARRGNVVRDLFFDLERKLTAADVRAFTRLGAYECLLNGVTEVWDHYYFGEAIAEALVEVGLAGVVAPTLQDRSGPGSSRWQEALGATQAIASDQRLAGAGVYAAIGPHATDTVSDGLWLRASQEAATLGVPWHAHLAQSHDEYQQCSNEQGCSPVRWLQRLGVLQAGSGIWAHGIFTSQSDLELLAKYGQCLISCPFSQAQFAFPADVARWEAASVPWAVATDCVASNDSMNLQKELRLIAGMASLRVTGSDEYDRFSVDPRRDAARDLEARRVAELERAAELIDPASLLAHVFSLPGSRHPAYRSGSIEVGARASLLSWDLSHPSMWPGNDPLRLLAYADCTSAISAMMVAGRWITDDSSDGFASRLGQSRAYADARDEAGARLAQLLDALA